MPDHIVIAVDGTAASGKGTLAKRLAELYNAAWLDTGLLYRYVGLHSQTPAEERGPNGSSIQSGILAERTVQIASAFAISFSLDQLHDVDLRSEEASQGASLVGALPEVRNALKNIQKKFSETLPAGKQAVIMDGRDIGTVIAPQAQVKFYVDANVAQRAERRTKELQSAGKEVSYEAVLEAMRQRDARDTGRDVAPTFAAPDACVIDTTHLSVAEMLEKATDHIALTCPGLKAVR